MILSSDIKLGDPQYLDRPIDPLPPSVRSQYKFIDSVTRQTLTNVKLYNTLEHLTGLGISIPGVHEFDYLEAKNQYTAVISGYKPKAFQPQIGKLITVELERIIEVKYKFVDNTTGLTINNISISNRNRQTNTANFKNVNGVYVFNKNTLGNYYSISASGYNNTTILVKEHDGVQTIRLNQKSAIVNFIDSVTNNKISNVIIRTGLVASLKDLKTTTGTYTFKLFNYNKDYIANVPGYKPVVFRPLLGRTINISLVRNIVSQYKFVDGKTGKLVTNLKLIANTTGSLTGLGVPSYSNGVYTFTNIDINKNYKASAVGYNNNIFKVTEHTGVKTIVLSPQIASVKFVDSITKTVLTNVAVKSGLLGLGVNYTSNNGIYNFVFRPLEKPKDYNVVANGYEEKKVSIIPGKIMTIELKPIDVVIDDPIDKPVDNSRRLRMIRVRAIARLRILKLMKF